MSKFGVPENLIQATRQVYEDSSMTFKIDDEQREVNIRIGAHQGSREGPIIFRFIIAALAQTLEWPASIEKPEYAIPKDARAELRGVNWRCKPKGKFKSNFLAYVDDMALAFCSRTDIATGTRYFISHAARFGLQVHVGTVHNTEGKREDSKTECMAIPPAGQPYDALDTSDISTSSNHFVSFAEIFRYLGTHIHYSMKSQVDINQRLRKAANAYGAIRKVLCNRQIQAKVRGQIYLITVVAVLLYGCETWAITEDLMHRLRLYHRKCIRWMTHFTLYKQWRLRTSTKKLESKLGIHDIEYYYRQRIIRWMGELARMPEERLPKRMMTAYVEHPRKHGRPQQNLGHTYENVLKKSEINTSIRQWTQLAQNQSEWKKHN
jgi:hypothetical protein